MMRLESKVAVVTGGGRGIGKAIACRFAKEGADIAIIARSKAEIDEVAEEINKFGKTALPISLDVTDEEQVKNAFKLIYNTFGSIDVLVTSAGIFYPGSIFDIKTSDWDKTMDINLKGTFLSCKEAALYMSPKKSGSIIIISSIWGLNGGPDRLSYITSKHGLIGLAKAIAADLKGLKIRVNALCPGPVDTKMTRDASPGTDFTNWMKPEDIVPPAIFLASDESGHITGSAIEVFGYGVPAKF